MANQHKKISELPSANSLLDSDEFILTRNFVSVKVRVDEFRRKSSTPSINEQTANYVLTAASDGGSIIELNSTSNIYLTIPSDDIINYPLGTTITLTQTGNGTAKVNSYPGVSISFPNTELLEIKEQYGMAFLYKRNANNWGLDGYLAEAVSNAVGSINHSLPAITQSAVGTSIITTGSIIQTLPSVSQSMIGVLSNVTGGFLEFDGASDFVEWTNGPSGVANSRKGTFAISFNRKGFSGEQSILSVGTGNSNSVYMGFTANNNLLFAVSNSTSTLLQITSGNGFIDNVSRVAMVSYDLDNSNYKWLFVNNIDETSNVITGTPEDIDYTNKWRIGSTDDANNRLYYNGSLGRILHHSNVFVLSDANTRNHFYSSVTDGPTYHGLTGSDLLGSTPPVYWVPTANNALINLGSGGNANTASVLVEDSSSPDIDESLSNFKVNAVKFNADTYFTRSTLHTSDQSLGLISFWFKRGIFTGSTQYFIEVLNSSRFRVSLSTSNTIVFNFTGNGSTAIWGDPTITDFTLNDDLWHHCAVSWNTTAFTLSNSYSIIMDGKSKVFTGSPTGNVAVDLNLTTSIGAQTDGSAKSNCDIAELYFVVPSTYVDLTDPVNMSKLRDNSAGKPVSLGLTGTKPGWGVPSLYLRNTNTYFELDQEGQGRGNWTLVAGNVINSTSSPTD